MDPKKESVSSNINPKINQYLTKDILIEKIGIIDINPNELGSTDSYNEDGLLKKYLSYNDNDQLIIYKCAVQLAIIGYGNKNYGFIRINDKETLELKDIFSKYHIRFKDQINAKFDDDELSARRLLRLFRYQIQEFIIKNKRPSYLWTKYADKNKQQFMSICFPGGEHLVTNFDEAVFLLETYGNLDLQQNTKFRQRLKRVFIARGIMNPEYFIDKHY
jgi:hypothetical protein